MNRLKLYINFLLFSLLSVALHGCTDDRLGYTDEDLREGETFITLEAAFSPFAEGGLSRASVVDPARGFNTLSDLVILVYDKDGNLILENGQPKYYWHSENIATEDTDRENADASNGIKAEDKTLTVKDEISLKVPFGEYYVIGVANLGTYRDDGNGNIEIVASTWAEMSKEWAPYYTLEGLRSVKVQWEDNYANNREMLGYFAAPTASAPHSGSKFETVKINRPGINLRAWLRRCASKITVDFDGSALRDNISIYIKDVRIYDLAKECTLGFGNPASDEENLKDFNNHPESYEDIIRRGQDDNVKYIKYIDFGEGDNYRTWPCINNKTKYILDEAGKKKDLHTQTSDCLYFYENMQGTKEGYDRTPIPDLENGGVAEGYNEKDGMDYGTYIEVSAYYVSETTGNSDQYEIRYRFMLGKNVTDNFDAERNFHYKLTLKFLGNANEYHWHIDYDLDGFRVPNPWYVSYLYNHDAYLPFEFSIDKEWEVEDMTAKIITNPWYPVEGDEGYDDKVQDKLSDPEYVIYPETPSGDDSYTYQQNGKNKSTGNGFLSLRQPSVNSVLTDLDVGQAWPGYNENSVRINQNYFENNGLGERKIIEGGMPCTDGTDREKINVKREDGNYAISIPLFTREKALVKQTGYTGNNPFVGYQRIAKVQLTAKIRKINDHSQTDTKIGYANVVQVRRVVNPKGVYRSSGNFAPFHVNLKFLSKEGKPDAGTEEFRSIVSRGPWMAEVLGDKNFITLDGKQKVSGSSRSEIDFTIRFNRMGGGGNKNAIVRIKYHNYTCTHLIFVRQGYDPQAICGGGTDFYGTNSPATVWNTFNMITETKAAEDPRDEGSLFKYGNFTQPIDAINNAYKVGDTEVYYELEQSDFKPDGPFYIATTDENGNPTVKKDPLEWKDIENYHTIKTSQTNFPTQDFSKSEEEIGKAATMRDFEQLYLTTNVEFGYGVLYADGATDTQSTVDGAYGWERNGNDNTKGMRGLFVYYWNISDLSDIWNGKNIFFPIGRSGYGHRKQGRYTPDPPTHHYTEAQDNYNKGMLRYACGRYEPASIFSDMAPLFVSLYRRPGAIYWARKAVKPGDYLIWNGKTNDEIGFGLDINYFTFDVNAIEGPNIAYGADACFVRTVATSAGD